MRYDNEWIKKIIAIIVWVVNVSNIKNNKRLQILCERTLKRWMKILW